MVYTSIISNGCKCSIVVIESFFHPPAVIFKSVYVSHVQVTTQTHSVSWFLMDGSVSHTLNWVLAKSSCLACPWYGLHASQSHMSFMCQAESKQRHEGSFRVACFSFLRAEATWEACVCTTENRGGDSSCQGPHRPKTISGASCWEQRRRRRSGSSCSGDREERVYVYCPKNMQLVYTMTTFLTPSLSLNHPLSFCVSVYVSSLCLGVITAQTLTSNSPLLILNASSR